MAKEARWPRFLAPARQALERVRLPEGPFQPQSGWEHTYTVHLMEPERLEKGEHPEPYGKMLLKRIPAESGRFKLDVDLSITTRGRSGMRTRAVLTCAADRLATPLRWELHSDAVESGAPTAGTSVSETGTLRDGQIVRTGRASRKVAPSRPFTTNWSLLEAVQRLRLEGQSSLDFDMLEDLDMYKPGQSLHPVGPVSLEIGGREARLHGFRQIGRGILPMHYWLDDSHRLIAVTGSLRAIIWSKL